MAILNIPARGFGPGAAIKFVATRGFNIGAAVTAPPNASLATRGFGQHGTIARLVTRYYGIGAAIIVVPPPPPPPAPSWDGRGGGPIVHGGRRRKHQEEPRRYALRAAYAIIRRNRKKLTQELRQEVLNAIVHEGDDFPTGVDFYAIAQRPDDLSFVEDIFARAIVEAELPEPRPINEYAPLAELKPGTAHIALSAAPDASWAVGLPAAIMRMRRRAHELADDDEEVLLLLS